ncbi:MAG: site-2 protease family protein [Oscillospiraceae bacterium]|nr:site-2 protease family protein [Oscillospiraceae bacterium]MBQ8789011.1 site-2 protease family protein [Oscillospiraceae bacterium]
MSILIAILLFGFMIFFHELGHFATAKWAGVRVNEFSIGMGPKIISKTFGETDYSLRLFPIGGFVAMEGEDEESEDEHRFMACPVWKRIIITSAGAIMNLILGFAVIFVLTCGQPLVGTTTIASFAENASSADYLEVNDRILAVNGEKSGCDYDVVYSLIRDTDGVVSMDILRNEEKIHLDEVVFDTRELNGMTSIILDFSIYGEEPTILGRIGYSFRWTWSLIKLVWHSLGDIISGEFGISQLSGPIGVTETISDAVQTTNYKGLLLILAIITVNLGVFNLLPLPALDGGRIFFMVIELFRGKPINQKVEGIIHTVGMGLLLLLMVVVAYNDIVRLITGG